MEDERTEELPPQKEPPMKSTPSPEVMSSKTVDEKPGKPGKPSRPPTVKRPSPLPKKSTPPPSTTTLQQDDEQVEKLNRPPPPPVSAAQDYNKEDRMARQRSSSPTPPEKFTPHLEASSRELEDNIPAQVEKPNEEKEDRATQVRKPEQKEMPEKASREQRRREREELRGGEEVEMIRVIRTSEGVTEQIVSGSSAGGDHVEGGGREREEEQADGEECSGRILVMTKYVCSMLVEQNILLSRLLALQLITSASIFRSLLSLPSNLHPLFIFSTPSQLHTYRFPNCWGQTSSEA